MINRLRQASIWLLIAGLLSVTSATLITGVIPISALVSILLTWIILGFWGWGLRRGWQRLSSQPRGKVKRWLWAIGCLALLPAVFFIILWSVRPDLAERQFHLPQSVVYDFIANHQVTERLVDPALFKVERWNIAGDERQVLFVHPAPGGSTALMYPIKVQSRVTFRTSIAVAPQAWAEGGDGVAFSVYVEDDAGFHLLYSQYVDPKHQQQDQRWLPVEISLAEFEEKLVRFILVVNSGPAGDRSYDWAGWGEPRLERPSWP